MEEKEMVIVHNSGELLDAFICKKPYILISKVYKENFEQNTQFTLSKNATMGFELGMLGWAGIIGSLFFNIINFFGKGSKQQKRIDSKIRKYQIKKYEEDTYFLYLRLLDY